MVALTECCCLGVARARALASARLHLIGRGTLSLAFRWRGVGYGPIIRRGGAGVGGRGGGERRARHDSINLMIVLLMLDCRTGTQIAK